MPGHGDGDEIMTNEEITKLRELEAAATAEPWVGVADAAGRKRSYVCLDYPPAKVLNYCDGTGLYGWFSEGDADFIAAARNAMPGLLDELERLRAENFKYRKTLAFVPAQIAMHASEAAGFPNYIKPVRSETEQEWIDNLDNDIREM
jgi:hypothetical protein